MHTWMVGLSVGLVTLGVVGCSGEEVVPSVDDAAADSSADGASTVDAGTGSVDTGAPPGDTGTSASDTGAPPGDTGTGASDTGAPPGDTGTATDGGPPPADTGTGGDASAKPLAIVGFDPACGVVSPASVKPTATFDRPIAFGTGKIVLRLTDGTELGSFDVATKKGLGSASISGATLTFAPSLLLAGYGYYFDVPSGAIKGTDGATFTGITGSTGWCFKT